MTLSERRDEALALAIQEAHTAYTKSNPKSAGIFQESLASLPGGTTRTAIHYLPFPLILASGEGAKLKDVDGHEYIDFCGEYSAGLFGHSHPTIKKAMHEAIDGGFGLGGVNELEGRVAQHFCSRFWGMDKIRFSNSGTEANLTALSLVRAYTSKNTIIVFEGGYHGGLASFPKGKRKTMNAPYKFVVCPYNDIEKMSEAVEKHKNELACIMIELMQGSSGCIPGDISFLQAVRDKATEHDAVLIFDEVMTSRMSSGGLQRLIGISPDMTTLGKYFGGGGQNFGAFGGKAEIMALLEPGHPNGVYHSGTYNNNITTMAAATTVLEKVWTASEADRLFALGSWVQKEIRRVAKETNSKLTVSGVGSLMNIHFTNKEIHTVEDVMTSDFVARELFYFDMLNRGFFLARRGMLCLSTVHTEEQLHLLIAAIKEFLVERKNLIIQP